MSTMIKSSPSSECSPTLDQSSLTVKDYDRDNAPSSRNADRKRDEFLEYLNTNGIRGQLAEVRLQHILSA